MTFNTTTIQPITSICQQQPVFTPNQIPQQPQITIPHQVNTIQQQQNQFSLTPNQGKQQQEMEYKEQQQQMEYQKQRQQFKQPQSFVVQSIKQDTTKQQKQEKKENISKQLKDEFEKISIELFKKQGMIAQNNHNILFDSSKTTTINRRKLQTGIQGYKGIVGKQHVIILF